MTNTNTSLATTTKTSLEMLGALKDYAKQNNVAMHSFLTFNGKMAVYNVRDSDGSSSELKLGTKLAVNLTGITRGFVCWKDKKQIGSSMTSIWDVKNAVKKEDLPDLGPFTVNDKVREGWTEQMTIPMKDLSTGAEYLFQVSARSALTQMDHFIKKVVLAATMHDIAAEAPVVEMDRSSFQNKVTGDKVFYPKLAIVDWVDLSDAAFTPPRARPVEGKEDDADAPVSKIAHNVEDAEVVD